MGLGNHALQVQWSCVRPVMARDPKGLRSEWNISKHNISKTVRG